jgi:hypothetical protein
VAVDDWVVKQWEPSSEDEIREFSKKLTSWTTYKDQLQGRTVGVAFEGHWLEKNGVKRCFVMEKILKEDWRKDQRSIVGRR